MTKTIHSELTCIAFQYAIRLIHEGAGDEVMALGLTEKNLQWIRTLTEADLQRLKDIRFAAVLVEFDEEALNRLQRLLEQRKNEEQEENELLRLGAHLAMMRQLCGMGSAEYAKRRRFLGLGDTGVGRPGALNEEQCQRLWHTWQDSAGQSDRVRYIALGRCTGIPLGCAWACIQQWESSPAQGSGEDPDESLFLS
jgi:hypothetical protein